jgi:hypothetical protein
MFTNINKLLGFVVSQANIDISQQGMTKGDRERYIRYACVGKSSSQSS